MREAAAQVDENALNDVVRRKGRPEGSYHGGLVWYALAQRGLFATSVAI